MLQEGDRPTLEYPYGAMVVPRVLSDLSRDSLIVEATANINEAVVWLNENGRTLQLVPSSPSSEVPELRLEEATKSLEAVYQAYSSGDIYYTEQKEAEIEYLGTLTCYLVKVVGDLQKFYHRELPILGKVYTLFEKTFPFCLNELSPDSRAGGKLKTLVAEYSDSLALNMLDKRHTPRQNVPGFGHVARYLRDINEVVNSAGVLPLMSQPSPQEAVPISLSTSDTSIARSVLKALRYLKDSVASLSPKPQPAKQEWEGPPGHTIETASGTMYKLVKRHVGGESRVLQAVRQDGLKVGLRVLPKGADRSQYMREVERLAKMNHPNVQEVYGVEIVAGRPVVVLEWVEGVTLDAYSKELGEAPSLASVKRIVGGILSGLIYAHSDAGVVHRDLKPDNIVISPDGKAKIIDWCYADPAGPDEGRGEPHFAAPERYLSLGFPLSDMYSLAGVIYSLLTGHPPNRDETDAMARASFTTQFPLLAHKPDTWNTKDWDIWVGLIKGSSRRQLPTISSLSLADQRRLRQHDLLTSDQGRTRWSASRAAKYLLGYYADMEKHFLTLPSMRRNDQKAS